MEWSTSFQGVLHSFSFIFPLHSPHCGQELWGIPLGASASAHSWACSAQILSRSHDQPPCCSPGSRWRHLHCSHLVPFQCWTFTCKSTLWASWCEICTQPWTNRKLPCSYLVTLLILIDFSCLLLGVGDFHSKQPLLFIWLHCTWQVLTLVLFFFRFLNFDPMAEMRPWLLNQSISRYGLLFPDAGRPPTATPALSSNF